MKLAPSRFSPPGNEIEQEAGPAFTWRALLIAIKRKKWRPEEAQILAIRQPDLDRTENLELPSARAVCPMR